MDSPITSPDHGTTYVLWHIPGSTLLLTSTSRDAVFRCLHDVLTDGVSLDDLMLQVTPPGSLLGRQYLGQHITEAMRLPDDPTSTTLASA